MTVTKVDEQKWYFVRRPNVYSPGMELELLNSGLSVVIVQTQRQCQSNEENTSKTRIRELHECPNPKRIHDGSPEIRCHRITRDSHRIITNADSKQTTRITHNYYNYLDSVAFSTGFGMVGVSFFGRVFLPAFMNRITATIRMINLSIRDDLRNRIPSSSCLPFASSQNWIHYRVYNTPFFDEKKELFYKFFPLLKALFHVLCNKREHCLKRKWQKYF